MDLLQSLHWRYATKKYSDRKVPADKLQTILDAINLSASSAGMQPYRLIVIENRELRSELGADSFNAQIAEASHLIVFAANRNITQEHIDNHIRLVAEQRGQSEESLQPFKQSLEFHILKRTPEENFAWAARQAYIALGTGLIAAAGEEVDATPMEGFNGEKFDKLLGLEEKGLKSVVLLALGYRDAANDPYAAAPKVRIPAEEFVTEIA